MIWMKPEPGLAWVLFEGGTGAGGQRRHSLFQLIYSAVDCNCLLGMLLHPRGYSRSAIFGSHGSRGPRAAKRRQAGINRAPRRGRARRPPEATQLEEGPMLSWLLSSQREEMSLNSSSSMTRTSCSSV